MTLHDRQRWMTRLLAFLVVLFALLWGLAAETANLQKKQLEQLKRRMGGQAEQIQVQ